MNDIYLYNRNMIPHNMVQTQTGKARMIPIRLHEARVDKVEGLEKDGFVK